jgi:hypothetical protein
MSIAPPSTTNRRSSTSFGFPIWISTHGAGTAQDKPNPPRHPRVATQKPRPPAASVRLTPRVPPTTERTGTTSAVWLYKAARARSGQRRSPLLAKRNPPYTAASLSLSRLVEPAEEANADPAILVARPPLLPHGGKDGGAQSGGGGEEDAGGPVRGRQDHRRGQLRQGQARARLPHRRRPRHQGARPQPRPPPQDGRAGLSVRDPSLPSPARPLWNICNVTSGKFLNILELASCHRKIASAIHNLFAASHVGWSP